MPCAPRSKCLRAWCAFASAVISAWASEQLEGSTTLTPTAMSRPVLVSNTAAPKGPPVLAVTLVNASRMANRMRSLAAKMGVRWRRAARMVQDGRWKGEANERPVLTMAVKASTLRGSL